jgi:septum formation protein
MKIFYGVPLFESKEDYMKFKKIVLASASPRRLELLRQIGIEPEVIVSHVEEVVTSTVPGEVVMELSRQKAEDVAKDQKAGTLVIGSDTVVAVDGKILGKPRDHKEAEEMIRSIEGRTHQVYTGVCMVLKTGDGEDDKISNFYDQTDVEVYPMTEEEILGYAGSDEPSDGTEGQICSTWIAPVTGKPEWKDKAGAYAVQGYFGRYIKGMKGSYANVMGLPISMLYQEMKKIEN